MIVITENYVSKKVPDGCELEEIKRALERCMKNAAGVKRRRDALMLHVSYSDYLEIRDRIYTNA